MASATSAKENEALFQRYYEKYVYAYRAASLRHINDIIEPRETRRVLVQSLKVVQGKEQVRPNKKHGNIPL
jgi:propionyl-CoA carboxylase beta chain